jgi:hypothetical protein
VLFCFYSVKTTTTMVAQRATIVFRRKTME